MKQAVEFGVAVAEQCAKEGLAIYPCVAGTHRARGELSTEPLGYTYDGQPYFQMLGEPPSGVEEGFRFLQSDGNAVLRAPDGCNLRLDVLQENFQQILICKAPHYAQVARSPPRRSHHALHPHRRRAHLSPRVPTRR